jgi:Kef-type K+ transport system membrane component KefB
VNFGVLALIVLAGLAGPLLGAGRSAFVPVVIGEILAGVIVGRSGLDAVDPTEPTVQFLSNVGFAMLMFTVGAHIPLRDPRLPASLRSGAVAAGAVLLLAPVGGVAAAWFGGTGGAAVYAVILGSGSAAAVLTMMNEARLIGPQALTVIGQVTIADVVTILAIPLVLQPSRAANAALGGALIAAGAVAVYGFASWLYPKGWVHRLRARSKRRRWALDLRLSLLVLFTLSWIAQESGTSVLIAGFGTGLLVAAFGGSERLFTQVRGLADGFFVPLFFVVLGARLQVGALIDHPSILRLSVALLILNVAVHLAAAGLSHQRAPAALIATAQLGVPAAVVTLGLQEKVLTAAEGAAIIFAALASLGTATLGTTLLAREARHAGDDAADEKTASAVEPRGQAAADGETHVVSSQGT